MEQISKANSLHLFLQIKAGLSNLGISSQITQGYIFLPVPLQQCWAAFLPVLAGRRPLKSQNTKTQKYQPRPVAASTSALASAAYLLPGGSGNDEADEIDADRRIPSPPPSDLKLPPDELELELKLDADPKPAPFLLPFLRRIGRAKHPNAAVSGSGFAAGRGSASMKAVGGARR